MSKIKPILFSTAMVQAILDGRKTQTRRIIKSNHESGLFQVSKNLEGKVSSIDSLDWDESTLDIVNDIKPKYQIGDIIWVREKWKVVAWEDLDEMIVEYANGDREWCMMYDPKENGDWICNYADDLLQKGIFIPNDETERIELVPGKKYLGNLPFSCLKKPVEYS